MKRLIGLLLIVLGAVVSCIAGIALVATFAQGPRGNGWPLVIVFGGVLIASIAMLIGGIKLFRSAAPLGESTKSSESTSTRYPSNVRVDREINGVSYHLLYTPPVKGKNARPSLLTISTPVDVEGEFEIVARGWYDNWGTRWGLAQDHRTQDEEFDGQCFVRTDTPEITESLLKNEEFRTLLMQVRHLGFNKIILTAKELRAEWTGFDPEKNDSPELPEEVGTRLIVLSQQVPDQLPEVTTSHATRRKTWQVIFWICLGLYAFTVFSLTRYGPIHLVDLLPPSTAIVLAGLPFFSLVTYLTLRGTSRSHYAWGYLMLGSLLLFPAGSAGTVALINGMLDRSPTQQHKARILRKYTSRTKNRTKYHVVCQSWRAGGGEEKFQIPKSSYDVVVAGQSRLLVTTRAGRLGIEWLVSKQVERGKRHKK